MFDFLNKNYPFNSDFRFNIKAISGISLGIFLFYLFFQPVEITINDFNSKLLFYSGFGIIVFVLMGLSVLIIPALMPSVFINSKWNFRNDLIFFSLIWLLISTASCFYVYYVGSINLSLDILFRILFLSLVPVVIMILINQFSLLKAPFSEDKHKVTEQESLQSDLTEITFVSDNQAEQIKLRTDQILLIRSANNYIEIFWEQDEKVRKSLIRSTLRKTEVNLKDFPQFIRCHRSCIINTLHVEKLTGSSQLPRIKLVRLDEEIPVSRQYLLSVREALQ